MKEKTTAFLMEELNKIENESQGKKFINNHIETLPDESFFSYINTFMSTHPELKQSTIITNSNVAKSTANEIMNGKKNGSRDKVLAICFACGMNINEVNKGLLLSGNASLHPKNSRDSYIIMAINLRSKGNTQYSTVTQLNDYLTSNNIEPLILGNK